MTFKQIKVGQKFSFRYGARGDRGVCVKVNRFAYRFVDASKKFTVGTTSVEVVR